MMHRFLLMFSSCCLLTFAGCNSQSGDNVKKLADEAIAADDKAVADLGKAEDIEGFRKALGSYSAQQQAIHNKLKKLSESDQAEFMKKREASGEKMSEAVTAFQNRVLEKGPHPQVLMETTYGPVKIELFEKLAPITVKNFLQYTDEKFYDGTIFHRVIPDFMVQGGGFRPGMEEKKAHGNIKNESDNYLSNLRGTLAMARTPDPHSASAQFFINVKDNHGLDRMHSEDGYGYAVFGKVIDGMDVVDKIRGVQTGPRFGHGDVPLKDVFITTMRRIDEKK